jgi:hypothetical protein
MEDENIMFAAKEYKSTRLVLEKCGFRIVYGASSKVLNDEVFYMIDYGALFKTIKNRKMFCDQVQL